MATELRCPRCSRKFDVSRCSNCGNTMKLKLVSGKPNNMECGACPNSFGISRK